MGRHVDLHEVVILASLYRFAVVEVEKVLFEYPTRHLKLCIIYFMPEAEILATSHRKGLVKKKVRVTGELGVQSHLKVTNGLMNLPPLAGPIIRALFCRLHYLGRYIVAAALELDRRQAL